MPLTYLIVYKDCGTGRSNGNWAEGYFTMIPVIDNIIEQYASTVNKHKMEIYFNLFKRTDLEMAR